MLILKYAKRSFVLLLTLTLIIPIVLCGCDLNTARITLQETESIVVHSRDSIPSNFTESTTNSENVLNSAFDIHAISDSLLSADRLTMEGPTADDVRELNTLTQADLETIQAFLGSLELTETNVQINGEEGYGKSNIFFEDYLYIFIEYKDVSIGINVNSSNAIMISYQDESKKAFEFYRGSNDLIETLVAMTKEGVE